MKLIGFVGKRRAGKDTAAKVLIERGYTPVQFAGALKEMLRAYLKYINHPDPDRLIEGDGKDSPIFAFDGCSPRWAMQTLGTEWGRDLISKNLWVNAGIERCLQFEKVVVTDIRFPNEAFAIHNIGGTVIRVIRPGSETDAHDSERLAHSLPVDFEIINDSSVDILHAKVLDIVNNRIIYEQP